MLLYPSIKCGHLLPLTGHPVIPALIHSFHKNGVMVNFVKGIALMVWTQDRCCLCVFLEREQIFRAVGGSEPSIPQRDGSGSPGVTWGFPGGVNGEESTHQCRRHKIGGYDPWVRRIPWRREWQPTPVFLPGESHGQRTLVGCSPRGHKVSDMAEHSRSHLECGLILLYVTVLKKVQ